MFDRPYYYPPPFHDNKSYYYQNINQPGYNATAPMYSAHFQTPFEMYSKPKLPMNWNPKGQSGGMYNPPEASNNLLHYFKNDNGEIDFDKVFTTVGKLANTVQQVSPVVKDMGAIIKKL